MARLETGILGGLSGKLGQLVVYTRGGKTFVRRAPRPTTKKPTEQQNEARCRFAALRRMIRTFLPALRIGLRDQTGQKMVHCAAFSELWALGVVGEAPDCAIDYSRVIVSNGYWPGVVDASVERSGNKLIAKWQTAQQSAPARGDDEVYLAAYNADRQHFALSAPAQRAGGKVQMEMPEGSVHCYLFVASATNLKTSRSQYFSL